MGELLRVAGEVGVVRVLGREAQRNLLAPAGDPQRDATGLQRFRLKIGVNGGVAPVRNYIEELLPEVLSGALSSGLVFDLELPLAEVAEAYGAMDERRAMKVRLRP